MQRARRAATLHRLVPLDRQLRWLRAYGLVTYPFACVPFLFPFFAAHDVDEAQYGVVLTAYYAAMFLAEVPTGMLADRVGPHRMLVLGPLVLAAGFATLLCWPTYGGFLCGEVLLGLGHSLLSGPPTVVLYETLRAHGQEHRYLAEESRIHARRLYGTGAAFLLGGALVRFGDAQGTAYEASIVATCAGTLLAAVLATRLVAPRKAASRPHEAPLRFAHAAWSELRKVPVRWLLLYWIVLFTLLRFPFHDYQPYLRSASAEEPWFADAVVVGSLFALLNLIAAPTSGAVPRLVARFGRVALFWAMPLTLCASMLVMAGERALAQHGLGSRALCWLGVSMFFVQQVPFAMHWSLLHEFANHRIGPATRTTVLSALSLGARAVYALLNVALFALQATFGIAAALGAAGTLGALATALVLWLRPRGVLRGDGPVA